MLKEAEVCCQRRLCEIGGGYGVVEGKYVCHDGEYGALRGCCMQ